MTYLTHHDPGDENDAAARCPKCGARIERISKYLPYACGACYDPSDRTWRERKETGR